MIDKDGISRPDKSDQHMNELKNQTRQVRFDEKYPFRPRNILFRGWAAFFRGVAICVFNPFMVLKFHMCTFDSHNVKNLKKKGFVMTCNHVHYFDDLSIGTNLFCWRKIYFTTLDANIRRPMIGFFLRSLGGIPIPIESLAGMKKFNEDVSFLIKHNKPVLYNPEGSLWPYYRDIRPFKKGAFSMAVKNDVPVLPIVVLFKRKKKRNGKFKRKMFFAICNPVYADKSLPVHEQIEKLTSTVEATTRRVAEEWYAIQDCGFGDEKVHQKLRPKKELAFVNDQWVVKKKN